MSSLRKTVAVESGSGPEIDESVSETRLVEEARKGRQSAFGHLVRLYERRLLRVLMRFVRDVDLAEDLAQETFLRAYERLDQFDPARRFGPWLFRIGVNLTLDHHRRRKRRIWGFLFSDAGRDHAPDPATADPRVDRDLQQEVQWVIDRLPEQFRIVLVLRDLENFSTSEIAAILERTEATIRWRLGEARTRFAEIWEKRQQRTGPNP